jgi:hypothetical protein
MMRNCACGYIKSLDYTLSNVSVPVLVSAIMGVNETVVERVLTTSAGSIQVAINSGHWETKYEIGNSSLFFSVLK